MWINLNIKGSHIPKDPKIELKEIPKEENKKFDLYKTGKNHCKQKNYEKAAEFFKKAGVSGCSKAFFHLGHLIEKKLIYKAQTPEEIRLVDSIAGFYIEKGGNFIFRNYKTTFNFQDELEDTDDSSDSSEEENEGINFKIKYFKIEIY